MCKEAEFPPASFGQASATDGYQLRKADCRDLQRAHWPAWQLQVCNLASPENDEQKFLLRFTIMLITTMRVASSDSLAMALEPGVAT